MDRFGTPSPPRSERHIAFRLVPAVILLLVVLAAAMHAYGGFLGPGEDFLRGLVLPGIVLGLSFVRTGPRDTRAPGRPLLVAGVVFLMLAALWDMLSDDILFSSVLSPRGFGTAVKPLGYLAGYFFALYGAVRRIILVFDHGEKESALLDRLSRLSGSTSDAVGLAQGAADELARFFGEVAVEVWRRDREKGEAVRLGRRDPMRIGSEPPGEVRQALGGPDGVSICFKTGEWQHLSDGSVPGGIGEIVVPVLAGGELTAAIRLLSARSRRFSESELKLLLRVSSALGAGFFSSGLAERARRRREAFEAFVREVDDVVFRLAPGGRILALNERGARLLGVRPREVVGHSLLDLVPPDGERRARLAARIEALEAGTPFDVEASLSPPPSAGGGSGRAVDLRLRGVPFEVTEASGAEGRELVVLGRPLGRAAAVPGSAASRIALALRSADDHGDFAKTLGSIRDDLSRAIAFDEMRVSERRGEGGEPRLVARFAREGAPLPIEPGPEGALTRAVLERGEPLRVGRGAAEARDRLGIGLGAAAAASFLGVPLRTAEGTAGVLEIVSRTAEDAFGDEDQEFLSLVADLVASAIDRTRMRSERERIDVHQAVVSSVGKAVGSMLEFAAVASAAAREIHDRFSYLGVAIDCVSPSGRDLVRIAEAGAAAPRFEREGGIASRVVATGRALLPGGGAEGAGLEPGPPIAVPIVAAGVVVGVVLAGSADASRAAGPEIETLESVADLLSLAFLGARRGEQLRHADRALAASEAAAEEERRRLALVLQSIPEGVVVADSRREVTLVNPAAEEILGVPRAELIGSVLFEKIESPGLRDVILRGLDSPHEIVTGDVTIGAAPEGGERWYVASVNALGEPGPERGGFVLVLRDASAEKSLARMKDNFLSGVSHELRTPLTSIIGFSQMLLEGGVGDLTSDQIDCVNRVYRQGRHLLGLIDAVLDLARFGSGKIERGEREFDASEVALEVAADHGSSAEARGLRIRVAGADAPVVLSGDRARVRQAVSYLVDNAIKFSPDGEEIVIRITDRPNRVRIAVVDGGIGIAHDEMRFLFSPLYQVDGGLDRRANGLGLGLALVREIARLHRGRAWVRSRPGAGSVFAIVLKRRDRGAEAKPALRLGMTPALGAWPVERAARRGPVNVDLVSMEDPAAVAAALEKGEIDLGLLPLPLALFAALRRRKEGGAPGRRIRVLLACGRAGAALVARGGASDPAPDEIAVTDLRSSEAALAAEAMPSVPLRAMPLREIVARFETGEIPAAAVPEPFAAALATVEGARIVRHAFETAPERPLFVLAAAEETVAARGAELRALARAARRAVCDAEADPSAPARDTAALLLLPFDCVRSAALEPAGRTRFAPLDVEARDLEDAMRTLAARGGDGRGPFDPADLVDASFAAEMAEEEGRQVALGAKGAGARRGAKAARKKILVVDDNEEIRRLVELKLRGEYDVVTARDGREAVDSALAARPDVVLMDVMMPRLDGIEATRLLREDPATRHIPVIALTARTRRSDFDDMIRAGACGFVTKPFYPGELRRKVSEVLGTGAMPAGGAAAPIC